MGKTGIKMTLNFLLVIVLIIGFKSPGLTAEVPQYGGTLRLILPATQIDPLSWDNCEGTWKHGQDTNYYLEQLLVGDLSKGPRGTKATTFTSTAWIPEKLLTGMLAEKWEVQKSKLQIIFHLRKGVMWQEKRGVMKAREFTAQDVVYNFTRLSECPKVQGSLQELVERWEARDKYTVVVHLKKWNNEWASAFGYGYTRTIQPPEMEKAPGGPNKWENACGTGPFMITDYVSSNSKTYTRNPNYWGSTVIDGKTYKLPFANEIKSMLVKDETARISALRTGKVDIVMNMNWRYVDELKKSNPQLKWARVLFWNRLTFDLRMDTKPFNDIRVRRALNMAVNKKEIVEKFYGGHGELVNAIYPITWPDVYTPLEKLPPSVKELFTYNPEKAKKLLAEAGYPNGFTFKAMVDSRQDRKDLVTMIAAYLEKIGVKMDIEISPTPAAGYARLTDKTHPAGTLVDTGMDSPFQAIQYKLLPDSMWNASMFDDEHIKKTYEETISNPKLTEKQQYETLKKLAVYAMDQAPCIWLPGYYVYSAWWPWLKNYYGEIRVLAWSEAPIFAQAWIDEKLKKQMGY